MLESKKLRDDLLKAEEEAHHLTSELSHLREHPLYYLLELEGLSEVQMLDIREVCVRQEETDRHLSAAGGRGEQESDASEMREVKKKMADKSEQLKLLQGEDALVIWCIRILMIILMCLYVLLVYRMG